MNSVFVNLVMRCFHQKSSHYTDWLIGILILVYFNPYINGYYNPLYTLNNLWGFFTKQTPVGKIVSWDDPPRSLHPKKPGMIGICGGGGIGSY